MSNSVNVPRLVAEVQKRPALWDVRHGDHKARHCVPKLWQKVAQNVGTNVEQCKWKWKNLRDAYRSEVRRSERRIERDKLLGVYDPKTNYKSKWVYFPLLTFISEGQQNCSNSVENETTTNLNLNDNDNSEEDDCNNGNIKLEPSHDTDDDLQFVEDDDDDDAANEILFEEFQNIATPQAARRLSATLSMNNALEKYTTAEANANASPSTGYSCKCSMRTDDQIHFLEDLGREEQKLIKSTRQDISRSNKFDHINDSDYNFLISFLPKIKKMSELQNLEFRAKMCAMVFNILAPTVAEDKQNASGKKFLKQHEVTDRDSINMINSTSSHNS